MTDSDMFSERRKAAAEREQAEQRLAEVRRLSPMIRAKARRLEAMKRQNGFAEKIHNALAGGTA